MYETILVPVDGSAPSDAAADHAITLARDAGATLSVLSAVDIHALESAKLDAAELVERYEAEAEKHVDAVADRARDAGVDVQTAVIRGAPYRVILDRIDAVGADLVVMGSHGRRGVERYLLGSTTERVLRLSSVPVLVIRRDEGDYREPEQLSESTPTDA